MTMLRDYQIEICERVREAFKKHRSVMMQMPTGTGKTVVLAELVRRPPCPPVGGEGCARILIVAHRRELIEQIKDTIKRMVAPPPPGGEIVVESIQTISRRIVNSPSGGWGASLLSSLTRRIMLWRRLTGCCGRLCLRRGSWD